MKNKTIAAALLVLTLAGCAGPPAPAPELTRTHTAHTAIAPEPAPAPLSYTAAGDSITAWIDRNGVTNTATWVAYADGDGLLFDRSGWAAGGAQLAEISANTTPVTADVLIVMAGTNDLGDRWGTPMGERLESVVEIVVKSQAPRVILSAVAPRDLAPAWSNEWNEQLANLAAFYGWGYIDPWASLRGADGAYLPGLTIDGIHPTDAGQRLVAVAVRTALLTKEN